MKQSIILCFVSLLLMTGCDKNFGEINTNINAPEEADPSLLLPDILRDIFSFNVTQANSNGNIAADMVVKAFSESAGRYNWTTNGTWNHCYGNLRDLQSMELAAEVENKEVYKGVVKVLRAYLIGLNTQVYGDIPYSEATKGKTQDNFLPSYDSQEEVFEGILSELEEANDILAAGGVINGDIVYNGDVLKWRKFANSYRLRILLRLSEKWDVGSMIKTIVDNTEKYPLFENEDDSFTLTFLSSAPNQYPIYSYRKGDIFDQRLCKNFADTLIKYNDLRISVYAAPTANSVLDGNPVYVGVPNGMFNQATNNYNGGESNQSYIGSKYWEQPDASNSIMEFSELQFILAEAALKGWIDGNPSDYYVEGIRSSHRINGVEVSEDYLNQPSIILSNDDAISLRQILTQKWISFFYNGMEAYFEYRRTGVPTIHPGPDNVNGDRVPMRFLYPTEEQDLNIDHYNEVIARQGEDDINTLMWLVK